MIRCDLRSVAAVFGVLALSLTACTSKQNDGNTFVYCSEGSPKIFNPQLATDGTTFNASSRAIYNRLVDFEHGGTQIIPSLAQSWTISEDGLNYTFELRPDVQWHATDYFKPTRPFNADDVVFTFERMLKKDHPYHAVNGGSYSYFDSMSMGTLINRVEKEGDHRVRIVLNSPEAPFLANLAMDFASILSAEYADQMLAKGTPEKVDIDPVGTGPFIFQKYVKDSMIRYKANKDYFAGAPKIENLVFSITVDPSVRYQKLKTGECHLVTYPAPNDLPKMQNDPNLKVMSQEGLNVGYMAMNVEKGPLGHEKVREAIYHALNRDNYIKAIYLDNAVKAKNPIPPTMWSYNEAIQDLEYDPEKAKKLLKEAGFENGFKIDLWVLPVSRPYNPDGRKMGEMIQADLSKVGIRAELVSHQWATYLEKSKNGEHELILMGWTGDNGDPDNFFHVLLSCDAIEAGNNLARWCDRKFSNLVDQAKRSTDQKTRTELYKQAQVIFKQKNPWVTLAHAKVFKAMHKDVTGYEISPFGTDSFSRVEFKKD